MGAAATEHLNKLTELELETCSRLKDAGTWRGGGAESEDKDLVLRVLYTLRLYSCVEEKRARVRQM